MLHAFALMPYGGMADVLTQPITQQNGHHDHYETHDTRHRCSARVWCGDRKEYWSQHKHLAAQALRSVSRQLTSKSHILDGLEMLVPGLAGMEGPTQFWRNHTTLLDVGAGSGALPWYLQQKYGVKPRGVDILAPKDNFYASSGVHTRQEFIPVGVFDGSHLPFPDASYDIVSVMSTLHHAANNTPSLVAESMRVARDYVVILEDLELTPGSPHYDAYHLNVTKRNRGHDPKGVFRTLEEWYALFNATRGVGGVRHGFLCVHSPLKRPCISFGVPHKLFYVAFVLAVDGRCRRHCGGGAGDAPAQHPLRTLR